jgi:ABC-type Fe3+-siderophore transport system permease subunit
VAAYPLPAVIFLLMSAAVMWASFTIRPTESLLGVATVLVGIPFFCLWCRQESPHE